MKAALHLVRRWWQAGREAGAPGGREGVAVAAAADRSDRSDWTCWHPARQWPALAQRLGASPQALRHLQDGLGITLIQDGALPPDWLVEPLWTPVALTRDGARLFVHERDGRLACVTPQGRSGCLAASPAQAWTLMLGLPLWAVCLRHSAHGDLLQMQRLLPRLVLHEREALPDLAQARACLAATLGLPAPASPAWTGDASPGVPDLLVQLHHAVSRLRGPQVWIRSQATRSLFGHLRADQWRAPRREGCQACADGQWWAGTPATLA